LDGASCKSKADALAEYHVLQVQSCRAGIAQLNEFIITAADRGIHNFSNPQEIPQRPVLQCGRNDNRVGTHKFALESVGMENQIVDARFHGNGCRPDKHFAGAASLTGPLQFQR